MSNEMQMQRIGLTLIGVLCFGFIFDSSIGGGVILRFLAVGIPLDLFFVSLVFSTILFSFIWLGFRFYRQLSLTSFFLISGVSSFLFIGTIFIAQETLNTRVFLWLVIPSFNFTSIFLFTEGTKALSRISFYRKRGLLTAIAAIISLTVGAISIYLGVEQVEFQGIRITTIIVLAFTLSFVPVFIYLTNQGWTAFEQHGIDFLGERNHISFNFEKVPKIRNSVLASALFLMGSGMAHGVLVQNSIGTQETSRALAYLFTIPFLLLLGFLSDKTGRTIIIVGAITLNTTSQILSYFHGNPQLVASFEIAGYYAILLFITLKLSDEISPSRWHLMGISWALILIIDYLGGLLAISFPFTATNLSVISIFLMLIALVTALRTPDPFFNRERVQGYMVLEKDEVLQEKGVDENIRREIKKILPTISVENPKPIELEKGVKVALSKSGDFTAVAFLNFHDEEVLRNLKEFADRVEEENMDTLLQDLVKSFMDLKIDVDGVDVKFMEL
ncbi:MAG: hypothetical protein D6732_13085 [Methanobacteriota archaeon]|nr:MAG: hypothetical protein D6732_13085 [Euryarchaeota archaeon]